MIRRILPAAVILLISPAACAQDPISAIRADRWADAEAAAAQLPDPVAQKLVRYYRLSAPNGATAPEISAFIAQNPDWPNQALLERRRQEALVQEPDGPALAEACKTATLSVALQRCAEAFANAGKSAEAAEAARKAWISGMTDAGQETAFMQRWGGVITPSDQWARFDALAWSNPAAAARQIDRLDGNHRAVAQARLAFKRDDPRALTLLPALPLDLIDPGLFLEQARYLRRGQQDAEAFALWTAQGPVAERAAPADHLADFWAERNILARRLLRNGRAADAYAIAAAHAQAGAEQTADAEFLAGFIALRRIGDPAAAQRHFAKVASVSKAAITQGRAHYWLGRAGEAAKRDPRPEYSLSAAWPLTFYGQLAAAALGEDPAARIRSLRDPSWSRDQALDYTTRETARAAAFLTAWGDPRRARAFLLRLDELAPDPADRALTAEFATRLGMPDMAVAVARRMGRDGLMLPEAGWPAPYTPPGPAETAASLGLMRQESNFDTAALSSSGARGLMQLMPATAQSVARQIGEPTSLTALVADPEHNMRLGVAYFQAMLDQFGGSLPLAIAAYNAGPNRVQEWLTTIGDPRGRDQAAMIDWIEQIPIAETRNYVQRVIENIVVYRARRRESGPALLAQASP